MYAAVEYRDEDRGDKEPDRLEIRGIRRNGENIGRWTVARHELNVFSSPFASIEARSFLNSRIANSMSFQSGATAITYERNGAIKSPCTHSHFFTVHK